MSTAVARPGVVRRDVFCVLEHDHRDLSVAAAVCAGRFEYFGTSLELGLEPDWLGASLPPDEEWRIAWTKFYDGLDLAHAFAETADRAFLEAWERLVSSWIRAVPAGWDSSDVTARRVQNWLYAWQRFASAPAFPGLSHTLEEEIVRSVAEQAAFVRANLSPARNHRTFELYTLFLVPLALPAIDPDGDLLAEAIGGLHENLLSDVLPDGVHCEASTHYHLLALRSFLGARENARRFGLRFPDGFDRHLERACEFALHCHRPDGEIPALSDADTGSYAELLELAAELLGRPDFLYAATAGARGAAPRRRYVSFPAGGYFFQRSGWGVGERPFADERFLVFDCGPTGEGGHGHYDLLSIEAGAGGRPLLVDPGRFTYAEDRSFNWRHWFKGTGAHNTVAVDGLDQTPYRRRKPKGAVAQARFLGRMSAAGLDVLHGEAASPCYDAVHRRRVVFVGDEYWLVEDRLRAARTHRYDLRFHLAPEAWNATEVVRQGDSMVVRAPGVALVIQGTGAVATLEEGWFAPEYGRKLAAPVVSVAVEDATDADFLTLVTPLARDRPAPQLIRRSAEQPAVVEIVSPEHRDVISWNRCNAWWRRTSGAGEPLSFRACAERQAR